jgi:16S rRNA (adenine1518-N6/adenine1519-N6)-dimethyltransferase
MPRKLGQHFLEDEEALEKIAAGLEIKKTDVVVEIGPGHGELTRHLVEYHPKKIIAIEKDKYLAEALPRDLSPLLTGTELKIINADALKALSSLRLRRYKLIGNIPFYITGRLLRILSELKNKPEIIVLTVQKEVAERIVAQPPRMNLLAAITQFWADPEIIGSIPRQKFSPPPEVDSAIIRLFPKKTKNPDQYYRFVKILFKQPRKTILNNLLTTSKNHEERTVEELEKAGLTSSSRPQNLNIKTIVLLASSLKNDIL